MFAHAITQDDAGDREEQNQRRLRLFVDRALAAPSRLDHERPGPEAGHRLIAHAFLERRVHVVDDGTVDAVDRAPRLVDRHARLQPREQVRPVAPAVVEPLPARHHQLAHRDGHEHLRLHAERRAVEPARGDADDGHRLAVDDERLVEDCGVAAEPRRPVGMAQDGDEMPAGVPIVVGIQQPAERRLEAEHRKVRAGHEQPVAASGLRLIGQVGAEPDVQCDAGEDRLLLLEIAEHRVAEHRFTVPGLAAGIGTLPRSGRRQVDQLTRPLHRERTQQCLIEQREDRGVRADAKGKREDGDDRDERRLEETADGKLQVHR